MTYTQHESEILMNFDEILSSPADQVREQPIR